MFAEFHARRLYLLRWLAELATSHLEYRTVVVGCMRREKEGMCLTNIQGDVISRVTVLRAGRSGVRILAAENYFSLLKKVKTGFRGTHHPIQRVQGSFVGRDGG